MVERGVLQKAGELLDLDRKVLVVTDDGVPATYAKTILSQCREGEVISVSSRIDDMGVHFVAQHQDGRIASNAFFGA